MTAVNIIRQSEAVHILTDGAAYGADGTLLFKLPKVSPLLHINGAVVSRGSPLFAPSFAFRAAVTATSFDHLKSIAIEIALIVSSELKEQLRAAGVGTNFDLVVAGLSETSGPSSYLICNHEHNGPEVGQWRVIDLGPISLTPQAAAIGVDLDAAFPEGVEPDDFEPVADGLRVLEIQRKHFVEHHLPGFGKVCGLGAFAQLTTITPGEITMKIIKHWPDEVGKPLGAQAVRLRTPST